MVKETLAVIGGVTVLAVAGVATVYVYKEKLEGEGEGDKMITTALEKCVDFFKDSSEVIDGNV